MKIIQYKLNVYNALIENYSIEIETFRKQIKYIEYK